MHSNVDNLVRMANQIAMNFQAYPHEEAVTRTTTHLQRYWDPRMRRRLRTYIAEGGAGVHELVIEAEKRLKTPPIQPVDTGGEDG